MNVNFDVKEQKFEENQQGIPIAGRYRFPTPPGQPEKFGSAIGEYQVAPESGTYVLGSIDGKIKWIATDACEED